MIRFCFALMFILLQCPIWANSVLEYIKTKNGITLITVYSGEEERKIYDAFLKHLDRKLVRPKHLKIMIIADFNFSAPWNGIIGFDTLRYNLEYINLWGKSKDTTTVRKVILKKVPIDSVYVPLKPIAVDWSGSYDRTIKDVGLKILYKWSESDSSAIFYDRIYSLVQYAIDHVEKIKREQRRVEIKYYGVWPVSVLSIDTTEIKKIPLIVSGFDHKNIQPEPNNKSYVWVIIVILSGIFFFLMQRFRFST